MESMPGARKYYPKLAGAIFIDMDSTG